MKDLIDGLYHHINDIDRFWVDEFNEEMFITGVINNLYRSFEENKNDNERKEIVLSYNDSVIKMATLRILKSLKTLLNGSGYIKQRNEFLIYTNIVIELYYRIFPIEYSDSSI